MEMGFITGADLVAYPATRDPAYRTHGNIFLCIPHVVIKKLAKAILVFCESDVSIRRDGTFVHGIVPERHCRMRPDESPGPSFAKK
jgi:hypothetical protein